MKSDVYVISCQRNANKFSINCLESVRHQTVRVKSHIFIDDISLDETWDIVEEHILQVPHAPVELIKNSSRKYRLKNIDDAVTSIDDDDAIVCLLDGDDWLSTERAVEIVQATYHENPILEYVYTNWMYSHNNQSGISRKIPSSSWSAYTDPWITSAMATFKVSAYKAIPKSNFLDHDGEYFKMGTDHAYVLPLTHMLKQKHGDYRAISFIDMPLYVYQFVENAKRRRINSDEGLWETREAAETSAFIRNRGFLSE